MANKNKGPGRPFLVPQPKISKRKDLNVTDALIMDWFREILDPKEYEEFKGLPRKTLTSYVNTVRNSWLKVAASTSSSYLNYGDDEFQDLAGVQVGISFDPKDWKDPKAYMKKTLTGWLKGVVQRSDIERELEKQIVRKVLRGEAAGLGHFRDAKLVDTKVLAGQISPISGGIGVDNIEDYRTLAGSLMGFIDDSQSVAKRGIALGNLRKTYYKTLEKEAYYLLADPKGWVRGQLSPTIEALAEDDRVSINFSQLEGLLRGTKAHDLFFGTLQSGAFVSELEKPILETKEGNAFAMSDFTDYTLNKPPTTDKPAEMGPTATRRVDFGNSYSTRVFLNKLRFKNKAAVTQFRDFVAENYRELKFSSPQAVIDCFNTQLAGPNLGAVSGNAVTNAYRIGREAGRQVLDSGGNVVRELSTSDLIAFNNVITSLDLRINKIESALNDAQEALFRFSPEEYLDSIADLIGDDEEKQRYLNRSKAALKHKMYAEVRNLQLATAEFFDAVENGNFFNFYLFLGKYNDTLPPQVQKIKEQIDDIPLWGPYKLKDAVKKGEEVKNYLSYNVLGLTQADRINNAYTADKVPIFALFATNEFYLMHPDLARQSVEFDFYSYIDNENKRVKIDIFKGSTYDNYKRRYREFSEELMYLKPAQLRVLAKDLDGIEDVYEGLFRIADKVYHDFGTNQVDGVSTYLKTMYAAWKYNDESMDFLDDASAFAELLFKKGNQVATPEDIERYKEAFGKIFKYFKKIQTSEDFDPEDFFGFLVDLKQNKYILDGGQYDEALGRVAFKLKTNMPLLNKIAARLSNFQTYLVKFTEDKLLYNVFFKIPYIGQSLSRLWEMWKPGIGSVDRANLWVNSLRTSPFGGVLQRFANSRMYSALKVLAKKLAPAWFTASTAATLGIAYLAHVIQKAVSRFGSATWQFIRTRNFRVFLIATTGFLDDIFIAPIRFLGKITFKFTIIVFFVFFGIYFTISYFFQSIIAGDSMSQYKRPDYGGVITLDDAHRSVVGEEVCYDFAQGNFADPNLVNYFNPSGVFSNVVTSPPGFRILRDTKGFHHGIDFDGTTGDILNNPFTGAIVESAVESNSGYGNNVILKVDVSGTPHYVLFGHLDSIGSSVRVGQPLDAGAVIGEVGSTGNSTGSHLHFELRVGENNRKHAENPCIILDCTADASAVTFEGSTCD